MIDGYNFGEIIINGKKYTSDVIIFPDRVYDNWWKKFGHRLCLDDLTEALAAKPEVLIIGTGDSGGLKVPLEVRNYLQDQGIELILQDTNRACQAYNKLSSTRKVVAALHLTC